MNSLTFDEAWPDSWKYSFPYDQLEIYGDPSANYGYAYAYQNRRDATLRLVEEVVPKGGRILDVAAAQGNFSLSLAERGYHVTWNDLREELVDYVRLKHDKGEIQFEPGDIFEIDFADPFDCVLITEIIEHVAHPDQFLAKIAKLVRPGGYIVMTTPNGGYFRNDLPRFSDCDNPEQFEAVQFQPNSDGHIFLLWPDEVVSLAKQAGMTVDSVSFFTTPLSNGHIKLHHILPYLPAALVRATDRLCALLPRKVQYRLCVGTAARFLVERES